ncbi:DNA polymerase III subunit gamma/tau [Pseudomonas rhizoryzae]|uniref:DNA polymerase III subunit gamma/tau n=1 Tax=Pseudomonas rhizoryzae TaxID=2571129 RepID=UPI0007378087|nr:DNA polymerase III subunit gamma/tau [Pseudomonas rhizoryzae]KTT32896.1 DNA polymerase III subunit gamma/tau [Pseudomonas psychrotolerans]KTT38006.1 DNA polymerase III subunit gamma/tau [Pseudomonas psychrotolerans]KTT74010.1 DNA polymerase III subunit gamma/tau [Pseudomonas psychrotolerans]
MSYQVLARKWRPRSFREMVGQTHVLKALINALDNERLHHAYLFTGTRGVGKTTIARILAKCLNCETGISSTPCGTCSVCREIDEGRFVDLIEVDAASRTKVEDTRELLENVQYAPSRGRYKVYLIDEVHMLSTHSFNALLKTLEEPPPHVKFLLATTDPQKLPVTILSRCLQFALKNMPPERVVAHLQHVLAAESIPFEDDALWLLGRAADGSMRDAMSLTDQAIAFGEGKVLAADVRAMLGTLDHGQVYDVLHALLEGDGRAVLEAVRHLAEQGPDWSGVLAELLNVLHRVAIAQVLPDAVDNGQGDRERVLTLAQALPAEDVQYYYQLGLVGRRDLPLAPDPRHGFEMVLLRMLAFRPAGVALPERPALKTTGASPATADSDSRPVAAAAPVPVTPAPVAAAPQPPAPATPPVSNTTPIDEPVDLPWEEPAPEANKAAPAPPAPLAAPTAPAVPHVEATPVATVIADVPADTSGDDLDGDEEPPPAEDYYEVGLDDYLDTLGEPAVDNIAETASTVAVQPATGLAADWQTLFPELKLGGLTASIAANCTLVAVEGDRWHLHLDPAQSALFNANQQRRLNDALSQQQGRPITLEVTIQTPEQETPAQAAARRRAERQREAEQSIQDDPLIRQMIQQFAATVRAGTIEPVDTQA